MKTTIRFILITLLTAVIFISGYELWKMSERYVQEAKVKNSVEKYSPATTMEAMKYNLEQEAKTETEITKIAEINQFIIDLQNKVNSDILGWITIPNTQIDYPFVISKDNNDYLRRDLYGNYALAGTVFMDYRCSEDFDDFNTIIYGHNMNNGSMFGELVLFGEKEFFNANRTGMIYLKNKTYALDIFAYMVVKADDTVIYSNITENHNDFFDYVKKYARNYREPAGRNSVLAESEKNIESTEIEEVTNIVTLSTCSYQFNGARIVLLAAINPR